MARVVADFMEVVGISHVITRAKVRLGPKGHAREMLPFIIGEVTR
jgi:hypothetical protein